MCLMSELWSSGDASKMIIMRMLRGLACGVPLRSHLLRVLGKFEVLLSRLVNYDGLV